MTVFVNDEEYEAVSAWEALPRIVGRELHSVELTDEDGQTCNATICEDLKLIMF